MEGNACRPSPISSPQVFVLVRHPSLLFDALGNFGLEWQICGVFQIGFDCTAYTDAG